MSLLQPLPPPDMGGKSSKESKNGGSKVKRAKKRSEVLMEPDKEIEHRQLIVIEHSGTKETILDAVMDALGANLYMLTMEEIEFYINPRYHVNLNAADQKKFVPNVVTNQSFNGCSSSQSK